MNKAKAKKAALRLVAATLAGLQAGGWPFDATDEELAPYLAKTEWGKRAMEDAIGELIAELARRGRDDEA